MISFLQSSDITTLDYIKQHCPVFQQGRYCPYNIPCLKGLGKDCPEFKNGCPFKDVKTVGEFRAKMGQMRDQCKGAANHRQALEVCFKGIARKNSVVINDMVAN